MSTFNSAEFGNSLPEHGSEILNSAEFGNDLPETWVRDCQKQLWVRDCQKPGSETARNMVQRVPETWVREC